jgi:hypothetical protein
MQKIMQIKFVVVCAIRAIWQMGNALRLRR